jgi:DNA-binding transcriptional ArsR family regulator
MDAMTNSSLEPVEPVGESGPTVEQAREAAEFLKALANETRLMILCILAEDEKSVSDLERLLGLRQPAVSQQLARLRADDLVATRREGKVVYYRLASEQARRIVGAVHEVFCSPGRET